MSHPLVKLETKSQVDALLDSVDYVLTDCDGVIYLSNNAIEGTPEVIKALRQRGKKVVFASNNSSKSRKTILAKLNQLGFEAKLEEIVVSCYLVAVYLKQLNFQGRVYVFGCQGIKDELDAMGIDNVGVGPDDCPATELSEEPPVDLKEGPIGAVVVGFDNLVSLPKLVKACTYASKVPDHLFIATNIDETFPTSRPDLLVPGTGCFVNFFKTALGREPVSMGKPGKFYWEGIRAINSAIDPKRTLMIGDRLNTDIAFGNSNGLGFTLLVGTGVNNLEDVATMVKSGRDEDKIQVPSHYIASLSDLIDFM